MTTNDVFIWDLLDRSPFLRSYLTGIEDKGNLEETVGELIVFYRELEELMELMLKSESSSDMQHAGNGKSSVDDEASNSKKKEVV